MKEPGKLIEGIMRDARFHGGPFDGQVRPVMLGAMTKKLQLGDEVHVYRMKRAVFSQVHYGEVIGQVFRYVGLE